MTCCPSPTQDPANLEMRHICISLSPILVFCFSESILAALAHNSVPILFELPNNMNFLEAGEAAARLHMLSMLFLVLLGAVAVLVKLGIDIGTYVRGPARYTLYLAFGLVVIAGAAFLAISTSHEVMEPRGRLGKEIFDQLFQLVGNIKKPGYWSEDAYNTLVKVSHIAILLTIAALISGSISCLSKLPGMDDKQNLVLQSKRLRVYIIISAVFLIISVLYFKSWANYPAFLLASEPAALNFSQYVALARAYTSFTGIEYSLVLAAYALPISYIQSRRANDIALNVINQSEHLETQPSTWISAAQVDIVKREEGLETKPLDIFKPAFPI